MKKTINIALRFSDAQIKQVSPVVKSVNVFPLNLRRIGNCGPTSTWALEYHSKDAGLVELEAEAGRCRRRRSNSVHIYAPGCNYREDTRTADLPLEENYFVLSDAEKCGFERFIDSRLRFAVLRDPAGRVGELMRKAGELCESNGERVFWYVQSIFMEIVQILMAARQTGPGEWDIDPVDEVYFAGEVEAYLRKNIANNVKISEIASYMKVSESSLNHRFKQDTGFSPIARLIEIRMDFAKSLLLKGEKLVNIAEMTGFYDEYHLSKTFKKQTGMTPREFRSREG